MLEMFLPLFRGATLVMVNQSSQKDPFQLLDVIKDRRVSVVQATPTTFEVRSKYGCIKFYSVLIDYNFCIFLIDYNFCI